MTEETLEERLDRLEKMAQQARDVQEIQNVMSRHCFLDGSNQTRRQVDEIWARNQPDVCSAHGRIRETGLDSIYRIADFHEKMHRDHIEQINRLFPDIAEENKGKLVGWMKMHTLCTPYGYNDGPPALSKANNKPYDPRQLCGPLTPDFPRQPVPYETFSETFSYGPDGE